MMLRSTMFMVAMAYGLAACGGDCDGGGGSSFASAERAAPVPFVTSSVLLDANNTVVIELVSTTPGGTCSAAVPRTTRLVWDPAQGTAVTTTSVPSSAARRVPGVMLGGDVTTWEDIIPGLTVRISRDVNFNTVVSFTRGTTTTTLTCSAGFPVTCM